MTVDQSACNVKLSHKCFIRIQSVYETLKSAEKKAADFMLKDPEFIASTTIVEVSVSAGCSEATLVRLARKLGFAGYTELKCSILQEAPEDMGLLYQEITPADSPLEVAGKVFQTSMQSLTDTLELLDAEQYQKALDHINHAGRILFIGAGDAYTVAYAGYLKFSRIGYNVCCAKDFDIQLIEASKLTENDLIIVVSHTGRTQTIYDVVKFVKQKNVSVMTITNYPISPIAKLSDIVLLTATFVPNTFGEIMTKRIPELCILETLYVNTVMRAGKQTNQFLAQSNKAIFLNKI